jgi:transcriptional regulator with XRE-family HTH domain
MNERDREIFGRNLTYYMNRNKVNGVTLAKYMNVSSATISDWMHGKKMPRVDKLKSLSNYFRINMSDLTDDDDEKLQQDDYYIDHETAKVAQAIFDDTDLHALFDAAQNSKPEDLKMAADLLRRLKGTNIDG